MKPLGIVFILLGLSNPEMEGLILVGIIFFLLDW